MSNQHLTPQQAARRQQTINFRNEHSEFPAMQKRWDDKEITIFGLSPTNVIEGGVMLFAPEAGAAEFAGKGLWNATKAFAKGASKFTTKKAIQGAAEKKLIGKYAEPMSTGKEAPEGSALADREHSKIPFGSKLLHRSMYSEVYKDPKGKIHVWGRPTTFPSKRNLAEHPVRTSREWSENALRALGRSKYRKSDPLTKDMAKIRKKFGKAESIGGYSRGAAYANYQPYDKDTQYNIYGPYTPQYMPDSRIKTQRYGGFDPAHDVFAKSINKFSSKGF